MISPGMKHLMKFLFRRNANPIVPIKYHSNNFPMIFLTLMSLRISIQPKQHLPLFRRLDIAVDSSRSECRSVSCRKKPTRPLIVGLLGNLTSISRPIHFQVLSYIPTIASSIFFGSLSLAKDCQGSQELTESSESDTSASGSAALPVSDSPKFEEIGSSRNGQSGIFAHVPNICPSTTSCLFCLMTPGLQYLKLLISLSSKTKPNFTLLSECRGWMGGSGRKYISFRRAIVTENNISPKFTVLNGKDLFCS